MPAAILVAPGEGDFARFLANVAFYAIFSAVIPTAMTRVMFMSEAFQSAADAVSRVEEVLAAPVIDRPRRTSHAREQRHSPRGRDLLLRGHGRPGARPREL